MRDAAEVIMERALKHYGERTHPMPQVCRMIHDHVAACGSPNAQTQSAANVDGDVQWDTHNMRRTVSGLWVPVVNDSEAIRLAGLMDIALIPPRVESARIARLMNVRFVPRRRAA